MDEETRQALLQITAQIEATIEAVGLVMEQQTENTREIQTLSTTAQRVIEIQQHNYNQLDERLRKLEDNDE